MYPLRKKRAWREKVRRKEDIQVGGDQEMKKNYMWRVINENCVSFRVWFTCWIAGATLSLLMYYLFVR